MGYDVSLQGVSGVFVTHIRDLPKPPHGKKPVFEDGDGDRLFDRARVGDLSEDELAQLSALLSERPSLADPFSPQLQATLERFSRGSRGAINRVKDLLPDLARVTDPSALPERFASDFVVLQQDLLEPRLPEDERAHRALEFFGRYAERFVALAAGEARSLAEDEGELTAPGEGGAPEAAFASEERTEGAGVPGPREALGEAGHAPWTREAQAAVAKRFALLAEGLGFGELKDARTGKTGTEQVFALAMARSVPELKAQLAHLQLEAAGPPSSPAPQAPAQLAANAPARRLNAEAAASAGVAGERKVELERVQHRSSGVPAPPSALEGPLNVQAPERSSRSFDGEGFKDSGYSKPGTDRRLGRNTLWNLLHRFRGCAREDSALARDLWDKVAVGALLFLFGLALLAVALVTL